MTTPISELERALRRARGALAGIGLFSALVNILTLTSAFYMMQIYDRVIPSRNIPTLVGLSVLALALYAAHGGLEFIRGRVLLRIGRWLDEQCSPRVYRIVAALPLVKRSGGQGLQPLRDLDQIRAFLASPGPAAFFDLPWLPFNLALCFVFHPLIGVAVLVGMLVLAGATLLTEALTREAVKDAAAHGNNRQTLAEASRRNAEVLAAMGMQSRLESLWTEHNARYLTAHERASDVAGLFGSFSKVFRMALQSAVLGLGAWLVIGNEASGGIIIASSIIAARTLAPVEAAIANWKGFVGARQGWRRLNSLLIAVPGNAHPLALPKPAATLTVETLSVAPPDEPSPTVKGVTFELPAGSAVGIVGPAGSGKSTLARALVGVWKPLRGSVRLDGAALDQWAPDELGRHIGYLPQDIELFDGTVGENIARFDRNASADEIIAAARAAGAHDMILHLPHGYETAIGEAGMTLSGGQRQRLALARALFGEPFLVVLDEPNSNLDAEGEQALTEAIAGIRSRGGIVVVVAHRPSAISAVNLVLVMGEGEVQAFGPKEEVLRRVLRPVSQAGAA